MCPSTDPAPARAGELVPTAGPAPAGTGRRRGLPARRRQVIVVSAMGAVVLAAVGGGWAVGGGGGLTTPAGPPPPATDQLARSACAVQVELADVQRQLDGVADTRREWEGSFGADRPPEVQRLLAREQALAARQAVLESRLRALRSIPAVRTELAKDQDLVAVLDRALAGRDDSPERRAQVEMLSAQRDYWLQQRDARQRELDRLVRITHESVTTEAAGAGSTATTDRVRDAVLELACERTTPSTTDPGAARRTAAAQVSSDAPVAKAAAGEGDPPPR